MLPFYLPLLYPGTQANHKCQLSYSFTWGTASNVIAVFVCKLSRMNQVKQCSSWFDEPQMVLGMASWLAGFAALNHCLRAFYSEAVVLNSAHTGCHFSIIPKIPVPLFCFLRTIQICQVNLKALVLRMVFMSTRRETCKGFLIPNGSIRLREVKHYLPFPCSTLGRRCINASVYRNSENFLNPPSD